MDVGAHHPLRFSNSYTFYEMGWRGICVDPLPSAASQFARYRPRDFVINEGVSEGGGELDYYMFDEPTRSTFSEQVAKSIVAAQLVGIRRIRTTPLQRLLERYLDRRQVIDVLSVDAEGFDLDVVRSIELSIFRPRLLLV